MRIEADRALGTIERPPLLLEDLVLQLLLELMPYASKKR